MFLGDRAKKSRRKKGNNHGVAKSGLTAPIDYYLLLDRTFAWFLLVPPPREGLVHGALFSDISAAKVLFCHLFRTLFSTHTRSHIYTNFTKQFLGDFFFFLSFFFCSFYLGNESLVVDLSVRTVL